MNLEKLKKYKATTKTITVKYREQEETLEMKQVSTDKVHLLNMQKGDENKPVSEIIEKNKPLLSYCLDVPEKELEELDFGFLMAVFEVVMENIMPAKDKHKEKLIEKIRNKKEE